MGMPGTGFWSTGQTAQQPEHDLHAQAEMGSVPNAKGRKEVREQGAFMNGGRSHMFSTVVLPNLPMDLPVLSVALAS